MRTGRGILRCPGRSTCRIGGRRRQVQLGRRRYRPNLWSRGDDDQRAAVSVPWLEPAVDDRRNAADERQQRPRHERLHRRSDSHALLISPSFLWLCRAPPVPLGLHPPACTVQQTAVDICGHHPRNFFGSGARWLSGDDRQMRPPTTPRRRRSSNATSAPSSKWTSPRPPRSRSRSPSPIIPVRNSPSRSPSRRNGKAVTPDEIIGQHGNRIHRFAAPEGTVTASYQATILGQADPAPVRDIDLITLSVAEPLRRGRQVLRFRCNGIRRVRRLCDPAREGVVLGGDPAEVRAGIQRPDRRRGRHPARRRRCLPRLRPSGGSRCYAR